MRNEVADGPLVVTAIFMLPKPASVKRWRPSVKPDLDKLQRAVLDGMTGHVFVDDSRVVSIAAEKFYAPTPKDVGVNVYVHELIEGEDNE
jgi:Holliday junction resolvase RusA-like endonuclease